MVLTLDRILLKNKYKKKKIHINNSLVSSRSKSLQKKKRKDKKIKNDIRCFPFNIGEYESLTHSEKINGSLNKKQYWILILPYCGLSWIWGPFIFISPIYDDGSLKEKDRVQQWFMPTKNFLSPRSEKEITQRLTKQLSKKNPLPDQQYTVLSKHSNLFPSRNWLLKKKRKRIDFLMI